MRQRRRALPVLATALALLAASCGGDDGGEAAETTSAATTTTAETTTTAAEETEETTEETAAEEETTETTFAAPSRGEADLVIWADDTRTPVLEPLAAEFAADEGVEVLVQEVPFDQIRDTLTRVGPAGEGPDIVIGAHDWLGQLVESGAVAPLDLGPAAAEYSEVATQAFTYDGQLYGLPYAIENIALIRNTELVPEAPATFADLERIALELRDAGTVEIPLAVQQGPADPYHNYPLFSGFGASVFAQDDTGTYDPQALGLDSPEALEAAAAFGRWSASGLISTDVTYDVMIESFASGQAPFAITGPWAVSDPERGFVQAGVPFVVEPIPPVVDGQVPRVFVGVQGFMVSQFSDAQDLATTFLLDYVNSEDVQLALYEAGGRPPAMTSAFEQVQDDPIIQGFGLSGQNGQAQPAIPAMGAVWDTWRDAYNLIFTGTDPAQAFTEAATTIRGEIGS
jgi:arabinogalactan oligomer / maltooligosaccharide transport system substrate-binding protein